MAADIEAALRAKITAGLLSITKLPARVAFVACGTGRCCDVCDELIVYTDIEYAVELAHDRTVHLHRRCYWAWFDACIAEKNARLPQLPRVTRRR